MLAWLFELCGDVVMVRLFPVGFDIWFRCACVYAVPVDREPICVAHGGCTEHAYLRRPITLQAAFERN